MTGTVASQAGEATVVRRVRRPRPATREQQVAVGAIAAVAAVAVVVVGPAPTGVAGVDVVYRALFAVALVLAGSRARRWSLIVGVALLTAGGLGLSLIIGILTLALCAAMVVRDLRDRVWGAAIGGLAAVVACGLTIDLFQGASALVGAVGSGAIFVSGYRNSRTAARRSVRRVVGVAAALWTLGVVGAGVAMILAFQPLRDGVDAASSAVDSFGGGAASAGSERLKEASANFDEGHQVATRFWTWPARLVPGLAQHIDAVASLADAGRQLAGSAADLGANVDYEQLRRPEGGIDLARLEQFSGPILDAEAAIATATTTIADIRSPWLVPPLTEQIDELTRRLDGVRDNIDVAAAAVRSAPSLLGGEVPRRYLILLGNPAESRDLGGHIGNWAELTAADGVLDLAQVGGPLELSTTVADAELESIDIPESLQQLLPARYPQNWGGHLDFPTDARLAARLFERATGRPVDGVAYADPNVLASMLAVTGPIDVPFSTRTVDQNDVVRFLTVDQFTEFDEATGDKAVTELVRRIFDVFTATQLPGPEKIGALFGPDVREGRLRLVTSHDADSDLLNRVGLDYGLPRDDDGAAFLAVVASNANPSKIDAFGRRTTSISTSWDPSTGDLRHTVTIRVRNDAPASGLPGVIIGNKNGRPSGTNSTVLAVLSNSKDLESATVDGDPVPLAPIEDGAGYRHQVRVDIAPGATAVVEFVIADVVDPGPTFQLFVAGQPTLNPGTIKVSATTTTGGMADQNGMKVVDGKAQVSVPSDENSRISFRAAEGG